MNRISRICILLLTAALTLVTAGCHTAHTPGPAATCTEGQVCLDCGEELAPALGHLPGEPATCAAPQVCTRCGEVLTPALPHTPGDDATCAAPQICVICGTVLTPALPHTPGPAATCTEGQVCTVCGQELAGALGHQPGPEATCTEPQTCTRCGEKLAAALGHKVGEDGKCTRCGKQITQSGGSGSGGTTPVAYDFVPETRNEGHYHNTVKAYYGGNVLICGDYAMEYHNPRAGGNQAYAKAVSDFAAKYPELNVTSLIVPKCAAFYPPAGVTDPFDNNVSFIHNTYNMMDGRIKKADAIGVMAGHRGEYMFYRTDHHWTSLGAYYASVAYCQANGIDPYPLDSYQTVVNTGFIGTLYKYAGYPSILKTNPDYTVGHLPHVQYTMQYTNGGRWSNGTAINTRSNSYAGMFICGDQALEVFETSNKNGKSLIVFKESYGNAFVPYMLDYYERVVVVDIRKTTDSVKTLIQRYAVTDALVINNVQAVSSSGTVRNKIMS